MKRLWGFAKVRYRGMAKNANRAFAMLAMRQHSASKRPIAILQKIPTDPKFDFVDRRKIDRVGTREECD